MIFLKEIRLYSLANILLPFLIINCAGLNEVQVCLEFGCLPSDIVSSKLVGNCFLWINLAFNYRKFDCLTEISNYSKSELGNQTCEFNYDVMYQYVTAVLPDDLTMKDVSWFCKLNNTRDLCDGESQCLTDECGCAGEYPHDLFFCVDGSGCISWSKLCDNIQDCKDGSDECFCHGHLVFFSPEYRQWGCFTVEHYCHNLQLAIPKFNKTPEVLKDIDCEDTFALEFNESNPLSLCLENKEVIKTHHQRFQNSSKEVLFEYCRQNCSHVDGFDDGSGWAKYCQNIHAGTSSYYSFACNTTNTQDNYFLAQLCDGTTNCRNGADEFGCPFPDRFHCAPNVSAEWVHIDKVCDSVKDCSNGADECGTCQFEVLSSSEFLIQSKIIVAVTSIVGFMIIVLNLKEGYKCYVTSCASKIKTIDRIFLLQIFLYDGLMGLYLCSIVLASIVLKVKGDYCLLEQEWRASPFCSALGVIFSISSHGSLLAIAAVSITRFLTCHSFLTEISKRAVIVVSIIGASFNIFHSVLPLLPIIAIHDTFRTAIFFKNLNENPFLNKSSPFNKSRFTELYNKIFQQEGEHDIYEMSQKLSKITTKRDIFDLFEIGYYGNTGLCVHNIFKDHGDNPMYRIYKILYCTVLLVLLAIVSIAYIKIVLKQRSSAQASNLHADGSISTALTLKVALMIGSQLACWIPLIIAVWYFQYLSMNPASPMVFEAFALVVMPINSFLNPVFYSELYKKAVEFVNVKGKVLKNMFCSNVAVPSEPCNSTPYGDPTEAHLSNQLFGAKPGNQSTEVQPGNQSTEVQPGNQSTEVQPSNQSTEVQPSNQFTEKQPSNQSSEVQPSNQSSEVQPSNQSTEVQPSNQSSEVQPSNQSSEVQPSNQSTEVQPSNQSTEVQP